MTFEVKELLCRHINKVINHFYLHWHEIEGGSNKLQGKSLKLKISSSKCFLFDSIS